MKHWPVQDAKARFSELLDASIRDGPQVVTRRGVETVVVVPVEEWRRLTMEKPTQFPESNCSWQHDPRRFELDIPPRGNCLEYRHPLDFD